MTETLENPIHQLLSRQPLNTLSGSELLLLSRKIQKVAAGAQPAEPAGTPLKVALLGTANVQFLAMALRPFLYQEGFAPRIYEGIYGNLQSEALNPDSGLYAFQPDVLVVIQQYRDIHAYPPVLASAVEVQAAAERVANEQLALWRTFAERSGATVFLSNIVLPNRHLLGNLEANLPSGHDAFLRAVNQALLRKPAALRLLDFDALAADFGKNRWFDDSAWFISKQPFAMDALPTAAFAIARQIASAVGKVKKCLVVDLDNTLWGGILGDDGLDGINLDPNDALGEAYLDFQKTLKALQARGVLLAVCSKNELAIAKEAFEKHPQMVLRLADFAAFVTNWQDKAANLQAIAAQLNIGLDALVFFDDNPAEREQVRRALPLVSVIDVPDDPAQFSVTLLQARAFDWQQLSAEDLSRSDSLRANSQRESLSASAASYTDYLKALAMEAEIVPPTTGELERFTQLINKTNQFNLRTVRYSEAEITRLQVDPDTLLLRATLRDQFSDYGLIAAMILKPGACPSEWLIDTWVMSCRVFKRELELEMMNRAVEIARARGIQRIIGEYLPTEKNRLVADLYPALGFRPVSMGENAARPAQFALDVARYTPFHSQITIR